MDDFFIAHHFNRFPVTEEGRLTGVVRMSDVKAIPKEEWSGLAVRDVMARDIEKYAVSPALSLEEAFGKMLAEDTGWLVVVDEDRAVAGVMTRGDIIHLMEIKTGLEE